MSSVFGMNAAELGSGSLELGIIFAYIGKMSTLLKEHAVNTRKL